MDDEFERLDEKIEVQSKLTQIEITDIHERLDGHDKYLKEMTTALSFASALLVVGFLNLYGVI